MPAPYFKRTIGKPKYSGLWNGRVISMCPSRSGPTGVTVYDDSGYSHHGTITNGTVASAWSNTARAVYLGGTNEHVLIPHNTHLDITESWTLSIWVRFPANPTNLDAICGAGLTNGNTTPYLIDVVGGVFRTLTLGPSSSIIVSATTTAASTVGAWTHICAYMRNRTLIGIAINGRIEAETSGSVFATTGTTNLAIGNLINTSRYPEMAWDDFALYDRAVTPGEIRLLSRGRGMAYEETPPVYFNESATNLLDARRRAVVC